MPSKTHANFGIEDWPTSTTRHYHTYAKLSQVYQNSRSIKKAYQEVYEEEPVNPRIAESMREVLGAIEPVREVITSPDEETPEDHDITEVQEPSQMTFSHKRKSAWARELIQDGEKYGVPEGTTRQVKRPKPFSSYTALMCNLLNEEPTCFEETIQKKE
jgi:DNA polymerase sigma